MKNKSGQPVFIGEEKILEILNARDANRLVKVCFKHLQDPGAVQMPPKVYLTLPKGDFRAMPVHTTLSNGLAGIKWICVFPENRAQGIPSVIGTLLLNDTETGQLLAVMGANVITAYRTGAAGAVAAQTLALKKPKVFTIAGAGVQSEYQLRCHLEYFKFERVWIWSPVPGEADGFVKRFAKLCPALASASDLEAAVRDAQVIATCTPSRKPLIKNDWVQKGTHISAIGADAPGKQELETALLKRSKIYVDEWEQASHSGEINVPIADGKLTKKDVAGTLTDAVTGKSGRTADADITVFDSTGLAIQDIVLAGHIYKKLGA